MNNLFSKTQILIIIISVLGAMIAGTVIALIYNHASTFFFGLCVCSLYIYIINKQYRDEFTELWETIKDNFSK